MRWAPAEGPVFSLTLTPLMMNTLRGQRSHLALVINIVEHAGSSEKVRTFYLYISELFY